MSVLIDNRQEAVKVDEALEAFVVQVVEEVLAYERCEEEFEVSISFVCNEEMRSLNKEYRNIDKETDVLSFPLVEFIEEELNAEDENAEYIEEEIALGDIVISMEKAVEQSEEYGHSFKRELAFLLVHGMLHLLGYDHDEEASEGEIFDKQEEILKNIKID
ncbi:MAG TPA: rRNA maturation RNase YbeY [Bacillota bacterium]|jgi:probable rRNA maturation factor|nr:rRNA maturation RNase YbeY [Bacillota bacterium]HRS22252.1 rRNA maturation RNase YbeY [Clostridia bacterium]HRU40713.1 rRNA maturation RNase YbeY [Candidatus Diapherotrites archaeon]HQE66692.1 rRNA maturation RNase YbeY [Bacillota bacterium]HQI16019.1 rRNA maturation RNase YbeY [Bacillota bacterium]